MALITINGVSFDPMAQAQALALAGLASADASESNYILIQTAAPLSPDQKDELAGWASSSRSTCPRTRTCAATRATDLSDDPRPAVRDLGERLPARGSRSRPTCGRRRRPRPRTILPMAAAASHSRTPRTVDIVFHEDVDTEL